MFHFATSLLNNPKSAQHYLLMLTVVIPLPLALSLLTIPDPLVALFIAAFILIVLTNHLHMLVDRTQNIFVAVAPTVIVAFGTAFWYGIISVILA